MSELETDFTPTAKPSPRHPLVVSHLVMGLVFAGVVIVWALIATHAVDAEVLRWLAPVPLLVGGGVGLFAALRQSPR